MFFSEVNTLVLLSFSIYLGIIIIVGIFSARYSSAGISEYFIGGRKIHPVVVALSAVVSGRSAWLLLGFSGLAYTRGVSSVWAVVGYIVVELLLFLYYAPRIRRFTGSFDCITIPDFFAARFNDKSGILRIISVIVIIIFMMGYVSSQFVAGGKAFSSSFGIEQNTGVILTALIVLMYTMAGGYLAVSITDVIQAFFMIISLVILPIVAIVNLGGWNIFIDSIQSVSGGYPDLFSISAGVAIGMVGIGLGSPGNPHIITRYISIKSASQFRITAIVGTFWNILMAAGAMIIGLVGRAYYSSSEMLANADSEIIFPTLAADHLHPFLFGFVLASIFAAIMSTADSQLLVAASSVVRDIYEKVMKTGEVIDQKFLVLMSRIVVLVLVIVSLFLGLIADELVFWLVLFAWAGLGASLGPVTILSLFYRGTSKTGVIAGILTGGIVTIIWYLTPFLRGMIYELIPGFIISLLVTIVVSRFTIKPANTDMHFKAMIQKD